jgi:hypothetical protein
MIEQQSMKPCCSFLIVLCSVSLLCVALQNDLDDPERGMIFVCSATHKTKSMFFFLAQTEQGDIFKVTLETDEEMVSLHCPRKRLCGGGGVLRPEGPD